MPRAVHLAPPRPDRRRQPVAHQHLHLVARLDRLHRDLAAFGADPRAVSEARCTGLQDNERAAIGVLSEREMLVGIATPRPRTGPRACPHDAADRAARAVSLSTEAIHAKGCRDFVTG